MGVELLRRRGFQILEAMIDGAQHVFVVSPFSRGKGPKLLVNQGLDVGVRIRLLLESNRLRKDWGDCECNTAD